MNFNFLRRLLTIALSFTIWYSFAQIGYKTTEGELALRINANGILAIDLNTLSPASEYNNSTNHFLSEAGLWISARDASNKLYINSQMSTTVAEYDFVAGPLDTFTGNPASGDWNFVWDVSQSEIQAHQENFEDANYTVPANIENWPAAGGQDLIKYLAPFADYNNNGIYDPENGDYPYIKGNKAWYCIFNDNGGEHKVSKGAPLGIELHLMVYQIDEKPNNLFLEYYLINRSDIDYEDIRVGFMLGGENGNEGDNYFGSSSSEHAIFIYNGDSLDEGNFESNLPYVYCKILNQSLVASMMYEQSAHTVHGKPTNAVEFDHYLHARWKDGSELVEGGNGQGSGTASAHLFNVDAAWTEESESLMAGNRNGLAIASFPVLKQKEFVHIEYAMGYGFYNKDENVHNLLKSDFDALDAFSLSKSPALLNARVYPNPLRSECTIEVKSAGEYEIKVTDIQGLTLYSENKYINQITRCNFMLCPGIYILELNRNGRTFKKLINVQP